MSNHLPPLELPALPDPAYGGQEGPYATSSLRDVCGTRINPDAAEFYIRDQALSPTSDLSCACPWLVDALKLIGSFDPRSLLFQPPSEKWPLTAVIPQVWLDGEGKLKFPLSPATYSVAYETLISRRGLNVSWKERAADFATAFPAGSNFVLSFYGAHELKALAWLARAEFWESPELDAFAGVFIPDFSAFGNDPIPQSLFGERMAQVFARLGTDAGRVAIPTIAWRDEDSLRRQLDLWLSLGANTIHLDCYGGGVNSRLWMWRWLKILDKHCASQTQVRWIVGGITSGWAIGELSRIFPARNYSLMTTTAQLIAATRKATSLEVMAERFRRTVETMAEFRSGARVAEPPAEPDFVPSFRDCLLLTER